MRGGAYMGVGRWVGHIWGEGWGEGWGIYGRWGEKWGIYGGGARGGAYIGGVGSCTIGSVVSWETSWIERINQCNARSGSVSSYGGH